MLRRPIFLPGDILLLCRRGWLQDASTPGDLSQTVHEFQSLPPDMEKLPDITEWVLAQLRKTTLPEAQQSILEMLASDIITNAIAYGGQQSARVIAVEVLAIPNIVVSVGITDDLGAIPAEKFLVNPTTQKKLHELSDHGRGLFITRCFADFLLQNADPTSTLKEIWFGFMLGKEPA